MEVCKTKTFLADLSIFHTYLDIFGYLLTLSGTFQAYSGPCVDLIYSEPCYGMLRTRGTIRTLVYSESWHTQNFVIFKPLAYSEPQYILNPTYSEPQAYSEPWHIMKLGILRNRDTLRTL